MTALSLDLGDEFWSNKRPADAQKLRGGYYTPSELAHFIVRWAVRGDEQSVLEPSAGDGNFVVALQDFCARSKRRSTVAITAVEVDSAELEKGRTRTQLGSKSSKVRWVAADFFEAYRSLKQSGPFDVVVGNPPFIRFQHFNDESRETAFDHLRSAGYRPTKLANAWSAFVQLSIELLAIGGRLGMVVPAELLQVGYAAELRNRIAGQFEHVVLIAFKALVFPEIQQEVVLLLAEGKRADEKGASDIHTIELQDGSELSELMDMNAAVRHLPTKHTRVGMKWTALFLPEEEHDILDTVEELPGITRLGEYASVDVGIVTGRNSFFVLDATRRDELDAAKVTVPIVGRTSALRSIVFNKTDFKHAAADKPSYLLNLDGTAESKLSTALRNYLREGERQGVNLGYKCRIRRRWFDVPSVYAPDAFLFRQIHAFPLLVANAAQVSSTDTIHRVRYLIDVDKSLLPAAFFNSLTLAWAEVSGRSYGGGVLELEPKEAEHLPIPYSADLRLDPKRVDDMLRLRRHEDALNYVDAAVLRDYLGLSAKQVRGLRRAWQHLRDRRINRR